MKERNAHLYNTISSNDLRIERKSKSTHLRAWGEFDETACDNPYHHADKVTAGTSLFHCIS